MKAQTETTKETARNKGNLPGVERTFQLVKPTQTPAAAKEEEQSLSPSPSGERRAAGTRTVPTWRRLTMRMVGGLESVVALVLVWWAVAANTDSPTFMLPTPLDVAAKIGRMLQDASLFSNIWTTVLEAGLGFIVALVLGTTGGHFIGHSRLPE